MNLPDGGKAEFALPPQVSKELKQTIKDCEQLVLNAAKEAGVSSESSGSATPPAGQSKTADPKAMADEAAAKKLHEKLQGLPQKCAEQVNRLSAKLEKDYGIPREQLNLAIVQVAAAGVKFVDRVGFNMPKSYNVKRELVVKLIDERQQQLAGGTTGQPVGAVQTKKPQ